MAKQKSLLDVLIDEKLIDAVALDNLKKQAVAENKSAEDIIVEKGLIDDEKFYQLKAKYYKIPFQDLAGYEAKSEVLKLIPLEAAQHYRFVPIKIDSKKGTIEMGMLNPEDIDAREALKFIAHRNNLTPEIFVISLGDFRNVLRNYSTFKGQIKEALDELSREIEIEKNKTVKVDKEKIEKIAEDAPISKVVALIINHAIEQGASDIHIEPEEKSIRVRFRVDGVMKINLILPIRIHPAIVSRIKILARLKIDETRKPQDGRFFTQIGNKKIDFRISTLPTYAGEKVVMRILDPAIGLQDLTNLGLEGHNLELIKKAIEKPTGMILITGPTGSGKTTTLYSLLHILNQEDVNIISLEDPIEYYIEGVNQSQVQPEIGYTFATGLRSIVRQDPDKVLVGEIRDAETANLAVHAALTGHLVLSTLHTNDAIGVIPRLIDMGIEPYLIPSVLNLAVAQRLIRRLCLENKKEINPPTEIEKLIRKEFDTMNQEELKKYNLKEPYKIYEPQPSKECLNGTKGRVAVYEMMEMTSQLEEIILKGPSEGKLREEAKRQGMVTMLQDGILKALRGIVSFDEMRKTVEE
jgi:type IV pilus assembly protein PilB